MKGNSIKVYTAESAMKYPGRLMRSMIRDLWDSRSLAYGLMKRDISALYRQSFFGFLWAFIPALLTALTFSLASKNRILNVGATDIPYAAYVMLSVTLWQTFSEAVLGPVNGLAASRSFITKINFPREALFMAKFGEAIFNFLIKCVLITGIFIFYRIVPSPFIFVALAVVLAMIVLGQSIGLLLAPLGMIYQDFTKGLPLVLGLGMFITPVVYPMPAGGTLVGEIVRMNPLTYLISVIRDLSIYGGTSYGTEVIVVIASSIILFIIAWVVFRLSIPYVIERCP